VRTMTLVESLANFTETLDSVANDREEVLVTRDGHEPVVIVALADYESLKETVYLLGNPQNARRLISAIQHLESGDEPHKLAE
jgi:antitoxin YefM